MVYSFSNITKTEKQIRDKLLEIEEFCGYESYTTDEMQGEIQALKFVLNISHQEI
jgi:hypothetical protein